MSVTQAARRVGTERRRTEGPVKLMGAARYSMDNALPGMLHAVLVGATISHGNLLAVDCTQAAAVDGVTHVLTHAQMPRLGPVPPFRAGALNLPMQGVTIRYEGEPVAIVLATTLEAAEEARGLVEIDYAPEDPVLPGAGIHEPFTGPEEGGDLTWPYGFPFQRGDAEAALAAAVFRVDATYVQPSRHHNPMETSGTLARWQGDHVTVWDSVQASMILPPVFAGAFGIDPEDVEVICPYTGGGFGCKGWVWPHQILTAAAARVTARPVKLHLTRSDQYTASGFQPQMTQRVRLGADRAGRLMVLGHHASNITGLVESYLEGATEVKALYECPVIDTRQEVERVSVGNPTPMRCPNEGPGLWALESAMNELAHTAGIDPVDLRLANYAEKDPISGLPWSSKRLREAYREGARLFGWYERRRRRREDGPWRIGFGMASAIGGTMRTTGGARVRARRDGTVLIETNIHDIGTGLQTLLTQIAADELEVPIENIEVAWGHTTLPATGPIYGSSTMHTGSAVALACRDLRRRLAPRSERAATLAAIADAGLDEIVGESTSTLPGGVSADHDGGSSGFSMRTFGAVFVEVGVDPELGRVRLRRVVGSYSVGRIINPRTARSQMIGSFAWGWGKAVMEHSDLDPASGRWLSKNFSGVHVPANADIPSDITVHFVDEVDQHASAIGAKGLGEFGSVGVDAAVADAVHDAVGVRVRELPITPKRIVTALSERPDRQARRPR